MTKKEKNPIPYLEDQSIEELAKAYSFEYKFFEAIGAREDAAVIVEDYAPSKEDKADAFYHASYVGTDVIYQVSLDNGDLLIYVIDPETKKIKKGSLLGVVPTSEFKQHG